MGGMVLQEVKMCVGLVKLGLEFVVVFAQAVKTVIHRSFDAEEDEDDDEHLNSNSRRNNVNNYNYQIPFPYPAILP
ncbi:tRNA-guanine(15) transglycosylase [Bienertia sinuspersici]